MHLMLMECTEVQVMHSVWVKDLQCLVDPDLAQCILGIIIVQVALVHTYPTYVFSCRNVRRESMKQLDKHEKDGDVSEDEKKTLADSIQELTDNYVKDIDKLAKAKQDELIKI